MRAPELGEEAHKADRSGRAHHAEIDRGVIHLEEVHSCRFGRLCLGHHLLQMRPDQTAKIGEMSQKVLTPKQQPAELLFELTHGTRQSRLADIADFCRAGEVQSLAQSEEIADLVHLHSEWSLMVSGKRDNRRTAV